MSVQGAPWSIGFGKNGKHWQGYTVVVHWKPGGPVDTFLTKNGHRMCELKGFCAYLDFQQPHQYTLDVSLKRSMLVFTNLCIRFYRPDAGKAVALKFEDSKNPIKDADVISFSTDNAPVSFRNVQICKA